jgi:hypothetical protein
LATQRGLRYREKRVWRKEKYDKRKTEREVGDV